MKKFIEEFKAFALRGNVMDMAIGVIIGGAFTTIVTSLTENLIMALVLFCLLKAVNKLLSIGKKPEAPAAPTTKKCPFCCSEIPIAAVKCAHCASDLPKDEK